MKIAAKTEKPTQTINRATDVRELSRADIEATSGGMYAIDLISKWNGGSGFRILGRNAIQWTL